MPNELHSARVGIHFYITGPAFETDIPLHLMIATLHDFQSILDKTYLGLTGRNRMSREDRYHFELRCQGIKTGSLESSIDIVLKGTQHFLPIVSVASPSDIWEYTKSAFECLKAIFEHFKKPDQPTYSATHQASITNIVDNSSHVTHNTTVLLSIAKESYPFYKNMASRIQNEGVDSILFGPDSSQITLGSPETDIFNLSTVIDKAPITFDCTIIAFHKIKRNGKLVVCQNQPVPEEEFNFGIVGNQNLDTFILALRGSIVTVTSLREVRFDPFDSTATKIAKFQIISIKLRGQKP